nr:CBM_6 [uncultured Clostridium sp.]
MQRWGNEPHRTDSGDSVEVVGVDFGGRGAKGFKAWVASDNARGKIEVRLDGLDGPLVGTCEAGETGGWQSWEEVSCDVTGATGIHDLWLKFVGDSNRLPNVDRWRFEP